MYLYRVGLSLLIVSATGGWLVFLVGYLDSLPVTTALPGRTYRLVVRRNLRVAAPLDYDGGSGGLTRLEPQPGACVRCLRAGCYARVYQFDLGALERGSRTVHAPAAPLYAIAALALWHFGEVSFSRTHSLVRLLFLMLALVLVFDGDALFITLAAEAAILH